MRRRAARFAVESLEDRLNPGSGRFGVGVFDFAVSVRFNATAAQLANIRTGFQRASDVLRDATDGQHRFGTVTLMNNASGGEAAEFWVYPGVGRADAPADKYGLRGYHANLFQTSNLSARAGADGDALTIVREFARLAYGLRDEASGPNGAAEGASYASEGPGLSQSLMDNFFTRGGRADGGTAYTLNEFSVRQNFDPDGDTAQFRANHTSDWGTIAASRFPAVSPPTLPIEAAPPSVPVTFDTASGLLQSMLVIDRSNSMLDTPSDVKSSQIYFAERGANGYVDFTPDGLGVGMVSFAKYADTLNDGKTPSPYYSLTPLTAADRIAINGEINILQNNIEGRTNIRGGVQRALDEILAQPARSRNEVMVVLTDGAYTDGNDPVLLVDALKAAGIAVYTIGVGATLTSKGEQTLADLAGRTGGVYTRVTAAFDAQVAILGLSQELQGNGLVAQSGQGTLAANVPVAQTVNVETGADEVLFTALRSKNSEAVTFTVTSPSGRVIRMTDMVPDVQVTTDINIQAIRVFSPEAGTWTMKTEATAATTGVVQSFAYAVHQGTGVKLTVGAAADGGTFAFPNPLTIQATPQYEGINVTGATVTGRVTGPDGLFKNITLFDDGEAGHGDAVAGDGTYSALFNNYTVNGTYSVTVNVGGAPTAAAGDVFLFPNDPAYTGTVTPFTRIAGGSALVTGVPATVATTDLAVDLAGPITRLAAGETGTYTMTVTNKSAASVSGVLGRLTLPGGLTVGAITASVGGTNSSSTGISYNVGTLLAGGKAILTVHVTAKETGAFFATAEVSGGGAIDTDLSNNQAVLVPPSETPPDVAVSANLTATAGKLSAPVAVAVSDAESRSKFLLVTAVSSDPVLIPQANIIIGGTDSARTIQVLPTADMIGFALITVTVTDPSGQTDTANFPVTVLRPPNVPPTISPFTDQTAATDHAVGPLAFTVGDAETPADLLTVTVTTFPSGLFPPTGIVLGGTGADRTLTLTPAAGQTGSVTVTVTVTDTRGGTATQTFGVTVATTPPPPPPNTPPTISAVSDVKTGVGAAVGPLAFIVGDAETPPAGLAVTVLSSNTDVVPAAGLILGGTGANRTVRVTPAAGRTGTAIITLTVTDGGSATAVETFLVTFEAIEPPPPDPKPALVGYPQFAIGSADGGGRVAFFNPDGTTRFGSSPLGSFSGEIRTAAADFNRDGIADIIAGTGPGGATRVRILDGVDQHELFSVDPFEAAFTGGVFVAVGDLNGDGVPDLVITPDEGGGPRVDVYSGADFGKFASFFGIDDPNFRGGARASTGDMNGDGRADLIVAAGFGGGPRVAGFDGKSIGGTPAHLFGDFFAFEQALRNGIFVAAGDVDGDGYADLIAGGGPGGGPRVTVFGGKPLLTNNYDVKANFFGGDTAGRGGIRVAVKNLDGDARADIVVGAGTGAGSRVTGYYGKDIAPAGTPPAAFDFDAFSGSTAGVFVG